MDGETVSEFFVETGNLWSSGDDIFSVLEAWENSCYYNNLEKSSAAEHDPPPASKDGDDDSNESFAFQKSTKAKRQKVMMNTASASEVEEAGQQRVSHITVERNRRKQMNEHLSVLRSLMPCFYVKRGDQASIIGGVVEYINELQQVLQSLQAKKQRKAAYNELVVSPRMSLPISPRTPQPQPQPQPWFLNSPSTLPSPPDPSPANSSTSSSINDAVNELVATSISPLAEVQVKFSGPNLLLKTVSQYRLPGQVLKIISALEQLALEILHVSISTVDETMLNSFTIKIGIQCQLSAEELAEQIQHTFC